MAHRQRAAIERARRDPDRPLRVVQHVGAVCGESQLQQRAGKARAGFDEGEQAARRQVQTPQRAGHEQEDLPDEPVAAVGGEDAVHRADGFETSLGSQQQQADLLLVVPEVAEGIVQLAEGRQRPPARSDPADRRRLLGLGPVGCAKGQCGGTLGPVDLNGQVLVADRVG